MSFGEGRVSNPLFIIGRYCLVGGWDSLMVEHRTRDRKVAGANPGRSGGKIFFVRVNFVC